ncbi:FAD-binding oxidoreductase [Solirubrobacter ginsenosidimutans]|uniref:FAD-binding oxidoreductase n=1 Tax=Solirubrobacter ginsenosidimutans TaxID=490573 RepID=A0A9X3S2X2_9ACTN|nr:FAD-binding oxidoreductase [Solirubrobacter ginsenosidimutans]MDA0159073.1 FAD-binding oxidoreductase [Solirubrobacter ginsenosidimutans]
MIAPGDPGFREAAVGRVFNARKPSRTPAGVVFPETEAEVVDAVRLARTRGRQVSIRSGGHSWAAWSVRDGALLIDLGGMRELTFDADTGIATASPAVKGGVELTPFLAEHGRMFPGGHCETVGLGGFLLQGGQGWNSRRWGWGCENVVGIDVVTADGELVHANEAQHADLFWAARGSGPGFFGVVTRFHLRTHPAEPMFHDTRVFALDDLEPLLHWLHDVLPQLGVAVEPVVAATRVGRPETVLLLHTTFTGDQDPLLDTVPCRALEHFHGPTTIAEENVAMTLQNPEGYRYAADSQWTDADAATLYPLLRDLYAELPTEHSFSIWYGWAPARRLPDMAFSLERNVYLATYAIWSDAAADERHRDWVHGHHARLAEVGDGVYLGDSDFSRRPDAFMAEPNRARLEEIRARRDPDGLFVSYEMGR